MMIHLSETLGLITETDKINKTCRQIKTANFFSQVGYFFDGFLYSNQWVLHPRVWSCFVGGWDWGGILRLFEIPIKKTANRAKGSKVAEAGIEAAFSSGIQLHSCSWIKSKSIQKHPSFNVALLKRSCGDKFLENKKDVCISDIINIMWFFIQLLKLPCILQQQKK